MIAVQLRESRAGVSLASETTTSKRMLLAFAVSGAVHAAGAGMFGGMPAAPAGQPGDDGKSVMALTARLASRSAAPADLHGVAVVEPATPRDARSSATSPRPPRSFLEPAAEAPAIALHTPYYYSASELDRRARPITAILLAEPGEDAADGYVILRLRINEHGMVDDATVVVNDASRLLGDHARAVFAAARYAPGMKNGVPVKSEMLIEVMLEREPG